MVGIFRWQRYVVVGIISMSLYVLQGCASKEALEEKDPVIPIHVEPPSDLTHAMVAALDDNPVSPRVKQIIFPFFGETSFTNCKMKGTRCHLNFVLDSPGVVV